MNRRTYLILAISAIVIAIYQIFTLGYGDSGRILYNTSQAIAEHTDYAEEHLSIIYERKIGDETDFIHLKVDTTYTRLAKGRISMRFYATANTRCVALATSTTKWTTQ